MSVAEAYALLQRGDVAAAEAMLAHAPDDPEALNLMAYILRRKGDAPGALAALDRALAQAPEAAHIHLARGHLLWSLARNDGAVAACERALALGQRDAETWATHGFALAGVARHEDAVRSFDHSVAQEPNRLDVWFTRGLCLQSLTQHAAAVASFDRALALGGERLPALWNFRGASLLEADHCAAALESFERALTLAPGDSRILEHRAMALAALGRMPESQHAYAQAIAAFDGADPVRAAKLRYGQGMAHLRAHDLAAGWSGFETRWETGLIDSQRRDAGQPAWRGEKLDGALRIWREQGVGDQILFARLAPLAKARSGSRVLLDCDPRLAPLLSRAFPGIEVHVDETPAPAAAQCSVVSLGAAMRIARDDLGGGATFLRADDAKRAAIRARYEAAARGRPIIGISWRSRAKRGPQKSSSLCDWGALLSRDCLFVNVQYGSTESDVAEAQALFGCEIISDPRVDQLSSLDDFAAQVAALDQIVSTSNTSVHFAGALGVPCMLLAPPESGSMWYWGVSGETTPWYASVRIVRPAEEREPWAQLVARASNLIA